MVIRRVTLSTFQGYGSVDLELAPLTILCGTGAADIWGMLPWVFATLRQGRGVEAWSTMCGDAEEVTVHAVGGDFDIAQTISRVGYQHRLEDLPDVHFQYAAHRHLTPTGDYRDPWHKRIVGMVSAANLAVDPEIQVATCAVLADAVARGHQMVVENHSIEGMLVFRIAIASGLLSPKDVIVHRISASSGEGDFGDIQSFRFNSKGEYPADMGTFHRSDIFLKLSKTYTDLQFGRREK